MFNLNILMLFLQISACFAGPVLQQMVQLQSANVVHLNLPTKQYYLGIHSKLNYFEAAEFCRYHGMQLATINSREENDKLEEYMNLMGIGKEKVWLSGSDLGHEGNFVWLSTGVPLTFKNFILGQPDNNNKLEHCIEIKDNGKWNDSSCTVRSYFVCEY